jgi:hypothetical protein
MSRSATPAVAASSSAVDEDGVRAPSGEVHAWVPGTNQTLCGLALSRTRLSTFPHVRWTEVYAVTGGPRDGIGRICPRCAAAGGHRDQQQRWTRRNPRP